MTIVATLICAVGLHWVNHQTCLTGGIWLGIFTLQSYIKGQTLHNLFLGS